MEIKVRTRKMIWGMFCILFGHYMIEKVLNGVEVSVTLSFCLLLFGIVLMIGGFISGFVSSSRTEDVRPKKYKDGEE